MSAVCLLLVYLGESMCGGSFDLIFICLPLYLGAVLADLLSTYPSSLKVTALVRNPTNFQKFRDLGVQVIQGSFGDVDLITSLARISDITVNAGDSDDLRLNKAILDGQKARVVQDRNSPAALLHTSGVAIFADGSTEGKHDPNGKVWNVRPRPRPRIRLLCSRERGLTLHLWMAL